MRMREGCKSLKGGDELGPVSRNYYEESILLLALHTTIIQKYQRKRKNSV